MQASELLDKLQRYLQLDWIYEADSLTETATKPDAIAASSLTLLQSSTQSKTVAVLNLIAPPQVDLEILQRLSMRGNLKGIPKEADRLEQCDRQFAPFVEQLRQLTKGFQEKKLQEFIRYQI